MLEYDFINVVCIIDSISFQESKGKESCEMFFFQFKILNFGSIESNLLLNVIL